MKPFPATAALLVLAACATERVAAPLPAQEAFRREAAAQSKRVNEDNAALGAAGGLALCILLECSRGDMVNATWLGGSLGAEVGASYVADGAGGALTEGALARDVARAGRLTAALRAVVARAGVAAEAVSLRVSALPPTAPAEDRAALWRSLRRDRVAFSTVETAASRNLGALSRAIGAYQLRRFDTRALAREYGAQRSLLAALRESEDRYVGLMDGLAPAVASAARN